MLIPVRGIAVNVGEQTGDGRYIVPGAVTFADLPLPIGWLVDGDQHAQMSFRDPQIGNITSMSYVPGGVAFQGVIDDQIPDGAEALRRMAAGSAPTGMTFPVSIDPDDWAVQLVDPSGDSLGGGMVMLASSGVVKPGERFDPAWTVKSLRLALQRSGVLVAASGAGDPSVDGSVVFEDASDSLVARFTRLRIRGLTMCSVAAFAGSYMEQDPGPDPMDGSLADVASVVAAGARMSGSYANTAPSTWGSLTSPGPATDGNVEVDTEFKALPVHHTATTDVAWDGGAATAAANGAAELKYMNAWQDSSAGADPDLKGSYKFPHHAAGTDTPANLNGVRNALSRLPQSKIPDGDVEGVKAHLQAHLDDGDNGKAVAASSSPVRVKVNLAEPPLAWFQNPGLALASPLTITNEGRILGHIALKYSCHTGYTDRCVVPPMGGSYDRFHVGETVCSDGSTVASGVFAWGIPHADLSVSLLEAWAHYADARYGFGRSVVGEDEYGIWFSGALFPDIEANDISVLRALSMSGDWRRDARSGKLSLIAALAVNFPGFPIPRTAITASGGEVIDADSWELDSPEPFFDVDDNGDVRSLVACGRVAPRALTAGCGCDDDLSGEVALLKAQVTRMERLLSPLYPTIAERLDERTAR